MRKGSSRLRSDIALEVHSYSHVWALKVPLRPSDCHHFTTTHASLAKSCVWARSRRWYACECGRVGPPWDLLWYFNRRHLMSVKPDGPSITFPASSFGTRDGNKWEPLITCWRESHFCCYLTYRTDLFTGTILNMSRTSGRMLTKSSRSRFTHFYGDGKRDGNLFLQMLLMNSVL